jgi:hypothetical protein
MGLLSMHVPFTLRGIRTQRIPPQVMCAEFKVWNSESQTSEIPCQDRPLPTLRTFILILIRMFEEMIVPFVSSIPSTEEAATFGRYYWHMDRVDSIQKTLRFFAGPRNVSKWCETHRTACFSVGRIDRYRSRRIQAQAHRSRSSALC